MIVDLDPHDIPLILKAIEEQLYRINYKIIYCKKRNIPTLLREEILDRLLATKMRIKQYET